MRGHVDELGLAGFKPRQLSGLVLGRQEGGRQINEGLAAADMLGAECGRSEGIEMQRAERPAGRAEAEMETRGEGIGGANSEADAISDGLLIVNAFGESGLRGQQPFRDPRLVASVSVSAALSSRQIAPASAGTIAWAVASKSSTALRILTAPSDAQNQRPPAPDWARRPDRV